MEHFGRVPSSTPELMSAVLEMDGGGHSHEAEHHEAGLRRSRRPSIGRVGVVFPVEQSIYDTTDRVDMDRVRMNKTGLIPIDEEEEEPTFGVLRCFTDLRVLAADAIMLVSVVLTSFTAPLTFIWGGSWDNLGPIPGGEHLLAADACLDVVFMAHLLMRLRTSYMSKALRVEVVSESKILRIHLQSPTYWILWFGATTHVWTALGASMMLNLIKVVRVLRHLWSFPDSMWQLKDSSLFRLGLPVLLLIIASHWIACLLSKVGGYEYQAIELGKAAEYETMFNGSPVSPWLSIYLMAFVEAIYLLTGALDNPLGEGDSARRKMFGSLAIVAVFGPVGCVVVSMFISALVREQALRFCLDIRHSENKAYMLRAMQNFNIPEELQKRVLCLHEFQKMSFDREAFDILFSKNNLSPPLDLALRVYVYHDSALKNSRYLMHKEANYILDLISGFEDRIYLPNDYVIRRGQVGTGMYFMIRGEASVLVPDPSQPGPRNANKTMVVAMKFKGDHFGEVAMIMDCVRTAWVRANKYVLVSLLTRSYAEEIWKYYPSEREQLLQEVVETARMDRTRACVARLSEDSVLAEGDAFRRIAAAHPPVDQTPASAALVQAAAKHQPWSQTDVGSTGPDDVCLLEAEPRVSQSDDRQWRRLFDEQIFESRRAVAEQRGHFDRLEQRQHSLEEKLTAGFAELMATYHATQPTLDEHRPTARMAGRASTSPPSVEIEDLPLLAATAPPEAATLSRTRESSTPAEHHRQSRSVARVVSATAIGRRRALERRVDRTDRVSREDCE